ncbi:MAG: T9SS type A sorting domain-containing protein [Saprospiraceae bacterium]|nr:T9SS type A sorting domain-containing protein [Saprospiraceae bacterium]
MKKFLTFIFIAISLYCNAQVVPSCEIPQELALAYKEQVQIFALDAMLNSGTVDSNSIKVLGAYSTSIWASFAAIYNSSFVDEINSIFNIYCINNPETNETNTYHSKTLYVSLDATVSWTQFWLNNMDTTGNGYIDSLLSGINYSVSPFFNNSKKLIFEEIINLPALVKFLENVDGINYAELVPVNGQGNSIIHTQQNGSHYFDFFLGWGDCPAGCTSSRVWKFKVTQPECIVGFLGVTGSQIPSLDGYPSEINCNLTSNSINLDIKKGIVELFPNPANDVLNVRNLNHVHTLRIYDLLGNLRITMEPQSPSTKIDIDFLTPGFYFLQLDRHLPQSFVKL